MDSRVSIVTVVRNGADTIERTIRSVLGQSWKELEYIVIDGGSTDGTVEILEKYEKEIAYRCSERDRGIVDAFNKGIRRAKGEVIGIVNADDFLEKDAIEKVVRAFSEEEADIVYGNVRYWKKGGKEYLYKADHTLLPKFMSINHPAVFVKREIYERFGLFDERYRVAMDYELMLRFFLKGAKFVHVDDVLSNMSLDGVSDRHWKEAYREVYEIRKSYFGKDPKLLLEYGVQRVKRHVSDALGRAGLERIREAYRKRYSPVLKSRS
ncbi:glycosyltransferase family 2 protein [Hydrogenimonas sp.]